MPEWKPEIRQRLADLNLEPAREAAIVEELTQDLDDCYDELLAGGAAPTEAYRQTLAELGKIKMLQQELQRVERQVTPEPIVLGTNRRSNMIADLWQDLRFGSRLLCKHPGFTVLAVLTLALGMGANTAVFSVVETELWKPLPFPSSEQVVAVFGTNLKRPTEKGSISLLFE